MSEPPRSGAQQRGERTRERLLEAALETLAERGPRGLTHRAVAHRAQVSLGTTTYHFASRRDMLLEAFRLNLVRTRERAAALARAGAAQRTGALDTERAAEAITGVMASALREERASFLASYELLLERARDPRLRDETGPDSVGNDALYAGFLRGVGSRQPEDDAALVSALLQGLALDWLARPDDPEHEERVRRLLGRLLGALLGGVGDQG